MNRTTLKKYILCAATMLSTFLLFSCSVKPTDKVEGSDITYFELGNRMIFISWAIIAVVCIVGCIFISIKYKQNIRETMMTPEETEKMIEAEQAEKQRKRDEREARRHGVNVSPAELDSDSDIIGEEK